MVFNTQSINRTFIKARSLKIHILTPPSSSLSLVVVAERLLLTTEVRGSNAVSFKKFHKTFFTVNFIEKTKRKKGQKWPIFPHSKFVWWLKSSSRSSSKKFHLKPPSYFLVWTNPSLFCLFSVFSNKTLQFLEQYLWEKFHPVSGAEIWTHDLLDVSVLP